MIEFSAIDIYIFKAFICIGTFYYIIRIMDTLRWWNGSDENGNPK